MSECVTWQGSLCKGLPVRWGKRCVFVQKEILEGQLGRQLLSGHRTYLTCHNKQCVNPDHIEERSYCEGLKVTEVGHYLKMARRVGECLLWDGAMRGRYPAKHGQALHRYVLEHKLGRPIQEGFEALHSCDNPTCINPDHLREGSHLENMGDMVSRQRCARLRGSQNGNSKLTEDDVRAIRQMGSGVFVNKTVIARMFGVDRALVARIIDGRAWSWLNDAA